MLGEEGGEGWVWWGGKVERGRLGVVGWESGGREIGCGGVGRWREGDRVWWGGEVERGRLGVVGWGGGGREIGFGGVGRWREGDWVWWGNERGGEGGRSSRGEVERWSVTEMNEKKGMLCELEMT